MLSDMKPSFGPWAPLSLRVAIRSIALGAFAVATLVAGAPRVGSALNLATDVLVYQEDFEGEAGFPTSPEVDSLGIGGLDGASDADLLGPPPVITGTAVREVVSPATTDLEAALVLAEELGSDSFVLRGEFFGLDVPVEMSALVSVGASFPFLPPLTDYPGLNLWLTVSDVAPPAPATGTLTLVETDGDYTNGVLDNTLEVPLSAAQVTTLRGGAPFTLDLRVRRDAGTIAGSIEIDGAPALFIGPLALASIEPADEVLVVTQGLTLLESENLLSVPAVVRMDRFEIYQGTLQVPTLSPVALGALVLLLAATPLVRSRLGRRDEGG
jgi:hypothetical protein